MPFRARLKRVFGRSPTDSGSELSTTVSDSSRKVDKKRQKEESNQSQNTYKPGEMPKPKYGGPVNKEHQKTLRAFKWPSDDWLPRRRSQQSQYSPTASKPTSRMNSFRRISLNPKSRRASHVDPAMRESVDEPGDVGNVGLSRQPTHDEPRPWPSDVEKSSAMNGPTTHVNGKRHVNGQAEHRLNALRDEKFGKPFTEEELTKAVTNKGLQPKVLN